MTPAAYATDLKKVRGDEYHRSMLQVLDALRVLRTYECNPQDLLAVQAAVRRLQG